MEGWRYKLTPFIRKGGKQCDKVLREGYDPDHSPLGCPVYWRVVTRGEEEFYCSTFIATRDQVKKLWGTTGLDYCDPATGLIIARIETKLRPRSVTKTPPEVVVTAWRHRHGGARSL